MALLSEQRRPNVSGATEQCWCGCESLSDAPHPSYLICSSCGTAKLRADLVAGQGRVTDEQTHLYGDQYWFESMPKYGNPSITERARRDLTERAQYWLRFLLKYRLPRGRVLEI